jgi:hypothetical protein
MLQRRSMQRAFGLAFDFAVTGLAPLKRIYAKQKCST